MRRGSPGARRRDLMRVGVGRGNGSGLGTAPFEDDREEIRRAAGAEGQLVSVATHVRVDTPPPLL